MEYLKLFTFTLLVISAHGFLTTQETIGNNRMLTVGIMTLPSDNLTQSEGRQHYIFEMADIFIRQAGLFPVYIPYNITDSDLYELLDQINGVYFTGGDLDLYDPVTNEPHQYTVTSQKIFNYALETKSKGNYFPIIGICQGHELLHILAANSSQALGYSQLENTSVNTDFTADPKNYSRYLSKFDDDLLNAMANDNVLWHAHHRGIPVFHYIKFPQLSKFFNIISTNTIDSQTIVSTSEARDYPIYTTQYHPEVPIDFALDIQATKGIVPSRISQSFANFFASECNKNGHAFKDIKDLENRLVKNGLKFKLGFMEEEVNAYAFDY